MDTITFSFSRQPNETTFCAYCGSATEAEEVRSKYPTICGFRVERQADRLMFVAETDYLPEVIYFLEKRGFATEDADVESEEDEFEDYI